MFLLAYNKISNVYLGSMYTLGKVSQTGSNTTEEDHRYGPKKSDMKLTSIENWFLVFPKNAILQ